MIEKLNIEFLKHQFVEQSKVTIKDYTIDINGREISSKNVKLKLTEKEISIIIYLSKLNKPISINELQTKVWDYHSDIETHTVETHIYRLRKKISKNFLDDNFIISKNNGYQIK
jgi:DNA-binding response OmpR family regulator